MARMQFTADTGMLPSLPWKVDGAGYLRDFNGNVLGKFENVNVAEFVEEVSRQALDGVRER